MRIFIWQSGGDNVSVCLDGCPDEQAGLVCGGSATLSAFEGMREEEDFEVQKNRLPFENAGFQKALS
jgi:hypothetical protein